MTTDSTTMSPMRLARIAGVFYLLVGIFGFFSEGFVDIKRYVAGNAAETAAHAPSNPSLVRLGVPAHRRDGTFCVLTAITLYLLLKHVNRTASGTFVVLV